MEKAILKTIVYADIFDYPLKAWEIHKWLIGKKAVLSELDKSLKKLIKAKKIKIEDEYYFLAKRAGLVQKREEKLKTSKRYLAEAKLIAWIFKGIPWIKLVGVSGSLAMKNAGKKDDIDFFVITENQRIWITRIFILGILNLLGKRRKAEDDRKNAAGKICINLLLEENQLAQLNKNIYIAHEVLQMQVLWQKDNIYNKYLNDNEWALKLLPNWISGDLVTYKSLKKKKNYKSSIVNHKSLIKLLETLAKWIQLRYMSLPKGKERISSSALYFHPENYEEKVLKKYKQAINR